MKKSKIRVNYVDFILAGLILLILATLISMFFSKSAIVDITKKDTIVVTLKIDDIKSEHYGLISQNEKVYIGDEDEIFGKIKSIKYHKSAQIHEPESNEVLHPFLLQSRDNLMESYIYTAIVEIECQGLMNDIEFDVNNHTFTNNDVIDFCIVDYSAKASIINFVKE